MCNTSFDHSRCLNYEVCNIFNKSLTAFWFQVTRTQYSSMIICREICIDGIVEKMKVYVIYVGRSKMQSVLTSFVSSLESNEQETECVDTSKETTAAIIGRNWMSFGLVYLPTRLVFWRKMPFIRSFISTNVGVQWRVPIPCCLCVDRTHHRDDEPTTQGASFFPRPTGTVVQRYAATTFVWPYEGAQRAHLSDSPRSASRSQRVTGSFDRF